MPAPHDPKRFATAQALAALYGITLHCLDGDFGHQIFIATQGVWTRQLDTLDDVDSWLNRVTGQKSGGAS